MKTGTQANQTGTLTAMQIGIRQGVGQELGPDLSVYSAGGGGGGAIRSGTPSRHCPWRRVRWAHIVSFLIIVPSLPFVLRLRPTPLRAPMPLPMTVLCGVAVVFPRASIAASKMSSGQPSESCARR